MASFVEKATLQLVDKSSKNIDKINTSLKNLNKTALAVKKNLAGINLKVTGAGKAATEVNKLAASLAKLRSQRAIAPQFSARSVNATIAAIERLRRAASRPITSNVNVNRNGFGGGGGGGGGGGRAAGQSIAQGFISTLRGGNAGATIARGFLAAIGGSLQTQVSRAAITAASAPLNKEDEVQRLRAAGLSERTVVAMQGLASQLSNEFRGTTESSLLNAGREAAGRIDNIDTPEGLAELKIVMERIARNTQITAAMTGKGIENGGEQARIIEGVISQVGATNNPVLASAISEAILQGIQASGGDLSAVDAKRIGQQLSSARGGLKADSLLQLLLVRDEGGQRSTGEFRQLFQDTTRGNLNDEDFNTQVKQGLRDKNGRSTVANALQENFLDTVEKEFIPRLEKLNVDLKDKGAVLAAIDNQLGFASQGGSGFLADAVVNFEQAKQEYERARAARPDVYLRNPTTRQQAQAVNAQFQNVADQALGGTLPVLSKGLEGLAASLAALNSGDATIADLAKLGTGAVSAGVSSGVLALAGADAATRPLILAGISLSASAAALTGSAAALSGAAVAQGAGNVAGKVGGAAALLRGGVVGAGALAAAWLGSQLDKLGKPQDPNSTAGQDALKKRFEAELAEGKQNPWSLKKILWGKGAEEGFNFREANAIDIKASNLDFKETFQTGAQQFVEAGAQAATQLQAAAGPIGDVIAARIAAAMNAVQITVNTQQPAATTAAPRAVNTGPIGAAGG